MAEVGTIDFRKANGWGHALHDWTFRQECGRTWHERLRDWLTNTRRYSFMCHTQRDPRIGTVVKWMAEKGERTGIIYAVDYSFDPPDMFTLYVEVHQGTDQ